MHARIQGNSPTPKRKKLRKERKGTPYGSGPVWWCLYTLDRENVLSAPYGCAYRRARARWEVRFRQKQKWNFCTFVFSEQRRVGVCMGRAAAGKGTPNSETGGGVVGAPSPVQKGGIRRQPYRRTLLHGIGSLYRGAFMVIMPGVLPWLPLPAPATGAVW